MLTQRQIATLSKPGRHADGGCLYLRIAKGGSKSWVFMYRRNGKQTEIGLGSATGKGKAGIVTLEQARRKALAIHATIGDGVDPLKAKRARAVTFGLVADQLIDAGRPAGRHAPSAAGVMPHRARRGAADRA